MKLNDSSSVWQPTLLLSLAVVVPCMAAVGFAYVAVNNQHLATLQQLDDAYTSHLEGVRSILASEVESWNQIGSSLPDETVCGSERFAEVVSHPVVRSAICYDEAGTRTYPSSGSVPSPPVPSSPDWIQAQDLEQEGKTEMAAKFFRRIANETDDQVTRLRAAQSEVRCLRSAGAGEAADRRLTGVFEESSDTSDPFAISILANLELLACESSTEEALIQKALRRLKSRVEDYRCGSLASPQRLFLMKQLLERSPDLVDMPLLHAESSAALWVSERNVGSFAHPITDPSDRTRPSDTWIRLSVADGLIDLLLTDESIHQALANQIKELSLPAPMDVRVYSPNDRPTAIELEQSLSVSQGLPGWVIGYRVDDTTTSRMLSNRQSVLMIAVGGGLIGASLIAGILIIRWFHRRVRLTRLKNDLLGTVSHELKTPLSSIRLFVDTLLREPSDQGDTIDSTKLHDYLRLIRGENERLSRLIENFLTFSRHEFGGLSLTRVPLKPDRIAELAVAACKQRFDDAQVELTTHCDSTMPSIAGDEGALVSVLANLLDNALRHSQASDVNLNIFPQDSEVVFQVIDTGVGIPSSHQRHVFDRFYRVDQKLNRSSEGCGLGLSIVQAIVNQHDGRVTLASESGQGCTFTICLPTLPNDLNTTGKSIHDESEMIRGA